MVKPNDGVPDLIPIEIFPNPVTKVRRYKLLKTPQTNKTCYLIRNKACYTEINSFQIKFQSIYIGTYTNMTQILVIT